ncbi:MAG: PLP-dependent aminotransferase family protein [Janthinobacterium lividum]
MLARDDPNHASLPLAGEPLYARLAEHYRRVIGAGTLAAGDRMPSVRAFMNQHRVSLATALQTFRQLEDAGLLVAKPRSGYFVRLPVSPKLATVHEPEITALPNAAQYVGLHERISGVIQRAHAFPDALNLGGATASAALYPGAALQAIAVRLLRQQPSLLTRATAEAGTSEFKQAVAKRALSYGVTVTPDEVVVTSGGVEAMNLALRAVAAPGDTIAIESPAFFGLLQILESLGLRALEIPVSPSTGLSLEALEIALVAYPNIKALVVVPNLQNPLGCVMPDERKAALIKLCVAHGVVLIEDDPYRELVDDVAAAKPIKAWDRDGDVIYCPSFNKVLAPGMRLGWISPGRWHARIQMLKYAQSRHSEALAQQVAAEFIKSGAFERHLHRLRERLRTQRDAGADAIGRHFPAGTRLSPPPGGLLLWVALPDGVDAEKLFEAALPQGIRIAPGSIFSNSKRFDSFVRLSCPRPFDPQMEQAFYRLGRLIEAMRD